MTHDIVPNWPQGDAPDLTPAELLALLRQMDNALDRALLISLHLLACAPAEGAAGASDMVH
ncbi:MAG: hypothetical protein ACKVQR_17790 [Aquabacterium sp.]